MSSLEWVFVSLLSIALLFFVFSFLFFLTSFLTARKLKPLKRKPPKNKRKKKKFLRLRQKLLKQKKKQWRLGSLLLIMALLLGSGAFYLRNYQQNHLQTEDSEALVQSYYLLDEVNSQLSNIKKGENPQKSVKNIKELSGQLSSYGARKAYVGLAEENQKLLNNHFVVLRELGVNLNGQTAESLVKPEIVERYIADVESAKKSQTNVFKNFKVNEGALRKKQ